MDRLRAMRIRIVLVVVFPILVALGLAAACSVKTKKRIEEESRSSAEIESAEDAAIRADESLGAAKKDKTSQSDTPTDVDKVSRRGSSFSQQELANYCFKGMQSFPGSHDKEQTLNVCKSMKILDSCVSRKGRPIVHYDRESKRDNPEKILVFAVTHGDEVPSGSVARSWMNRLHRISPRNRWRIVPMLNPDGYIARTRMNAAGVDINRNYPSTDWDNLALDWWKSKKNSDPRRYPGPRPGSEPETLCSVDHIDDFDPDLIISIHTPLGVLDFDGPRLKFPQFSNLPWISLGTFPGSLGRYMWHDRNVPVLTIELKNNISQALDKFDRLQDISGQVALIISKTDKKKDDQRSSAN